MNNKRILVVDDDPHMRYGLYICLRAKHYDVFFAGHASDIIPAAESCDPDLIVLDLSLAGGGAFNIMKRFRTKDGLAAIPIIALCARDHRDEKDCILKAGAKAVLHKTVAKDELFGVIREILGQVATEGD
jgi:DNA-binding response OmpR family regulator